LLKVHHLSERDIRKRHIMTYTAFFRRNFLGVDFSILIWYLAREVQVNDLAYFGGPSSSLSSRITRASINCKEEYLVQVESYVLLRRFLPAPDCGITNN